MSAHAPRRCFCAQEKRKRWQKNDGEDSGSIAAHKFRQLYGM